MGTGYLYDVARLIATVSGLYATYCGDGDGATVTSLPENLNEKTPVAVVIDGSVEVTAASWQRQKVAPEVHVMVARNHGDGLGAAYELARSFRGPLLAAIQGGVTSTEIDSGSLVITGFRQIEDREWPRDSGRWYLSLPCELELKLNSAVSYLPPTRP
ncbi:MAG: hypothetical protein ABIR11_07125 [Candidatus Limnocylindrales bacterium]